MKVTPKDIFTEIVDGELVVRALEVSGDIVPEDKKDPKRYVTALINTSNGLQQALKVYIVGGGGGGSVDESKIIVKSDTIPTASAANAGYIYIYTGATNATYTHGYIYENKLVDAVYQWVRLDVQPPSAIIFRNWGA